MVFLLVSDHEDHFPCQPGLCFVRIKRLWCTGTVCAPSTSALLEVLLYRTSLSTYLWQCFKRIAWVTARKKKSNVTFGEVLQKAFAPRRFLLLGCGVWGEGVSPPPPPLLMKTDGFAKFSDTLTHTPRGGGWGGGEKKVKVRRKKGGKKESSKWLNSHVERWGGGETGLPHRRVEQRLLNLLMRPVGPSFAPRYSELQNSSLLPGHPLFGWRPPPMLGVNPERGRKQHQMLWCPNQYWRR